MPRLNTRIRLPESDSIRTLDVEDAAGRSPVARPTSVTSLPGEGRLRRVLDMIESQPSRSVSELAQEVHLTPAHLQRLFKQEIGVHVSDLIVEQRLQRAAGMLSSSDRPIKEIAHSVGYEHHSSFVRAFQRRFAQSPKHYRRTSAVQLDTAPSVEKGVGK